MADLDDRDDRLANAIIGMVQQRSRMEERMLSVENITHG